MRIRVSEIRKIISEAMGALRMLDTLEMQVIVHGSSRDIKVEEILTDIRVIKGVATVVQNGAINRTHSGKRIINIVVTFDSMNMSKDHYKEELGYAIKRIQGVGSVIYIRLNDAPLLDQDGKRQVF